MSHPLNATEIANRARDRRLRRRLLDTLHSGRGNQSEGWVTGRFLLDILDYYQGDKPEDDQHVLNLLRDLVRKAFAEERDDRTHKSQRFRLDTISFRATAQGSSLINESIAADPDIEDERL